MLFDDLVVKTKVRENHPHDLRKVFEKLCMHKLKMNPLKCAFGVTSEFLGFVIRKEEIEINPNKVKAIIKMPPLRNLYKVVYLKFLRELSTFHKTLEKSHIFYLGSSLSKCF